MSPYTNGGLFWYYEFFDTFVKVKFKKFICSTSKDMFSKLVNMFYNHLSYKDGIIKIMVCKQEIYVSREEFAKICNIPPPWSHYKPDDLESNDDFDFFFDFPYILSKTNEDLSCPQSPCFVRAYVHLIHYVVTHIHFPRIWNLF